MTDAPQIVEVREVPGATVRIGWFRREQVFTYRYDDGTRVIGYPVRARDGSVLVVFPLARDTLAGSDE